MESHKKWRSKPSAKERRSQWASGSSSVPCSMDFQRSKGTRREKFALDGFGRDTLQGCDCASRLLHGHCSFLSKHVRSVRATHTPTRVPKAECKLPRLRLRRPLSLRSRLDSSRCPRVKTFLGWNGAATELPGRSASTSAFKRMERGWEWVLEVEDAHFHQGLAKLALCFWVFFQTDFIRCVSQGMRCCLWIVSILDLLTSSRLNLLPLTPWCSLAESGTAAAMYPQPPPCLWLRPSSVSHGGLIGPIGSEPGTGVIPRPSRPRRSKMQSPMGKSDVCRCTHRECFWSFGISPKVQWTDLWPLTTACAVSCVWCVDGLQPSHCF